MKCIEPWSTIDVSPNGTMRPCCKFQARLYDNSVSLQTSSLDDYLNSEMLSEVKQEMLSNQWPRGCERCRIDEAAGIKSKRQLDYERFPELSTYTNDKGFITATISYGNTCNLKCIMCSPWSSSKWRNEWKEIYGEDVSNVKDLINQEFVNTFIEHSPNLVHLDTGGGEPLLSQVNIQQSLLRKFVDNGQSATMSLHYVTNGQQFPDDSWWDLWQHFKEVDIQLSIDGVDKRYEYIRYLADWDTLVNNVRLFISNKKKLDNIRLSVSHTVSVYNVYYLEEFFIWCIKTGLPKPYLGRVNHPARLSPEVWHDEAKKAIVEKLQSSKIKEVQQWANILLNNKSAKHNEFVSYAKQHDKYRGTSFVETFPELENFFKEIKNDN